MALLSAIKETDYSHLDLLPADFAYRKFDRLLDDLGEPAQVISDLLHTIGRDYDVLFLDCPPGFSLLTEGIFAAADAVLVPTIPTVLSLRTVARLIKRADRAESSVELDVFFNMVDRRKTLHRRACEWSRQHPELFLAGAGFLRQRRRANERASHAPGGIRAARRRGHCVLGGLGRIPDAPGTSARRHAGVAIQLGPSAEGPRVVHDGSSTARTERRICVPRGRRQRGRHSPGHALYEVKRLGDSCLVHAFDTERRDLRRRGISA